MTYVFQNLEVYMKALFLYCFIKKWFHILVYHFNAYLPSAAYMRQRSGWALVQIMTWWQAIIWTSTELLSIGPLGKIYVKF